MFTANRFVFYEDEDYEKDYVCSHIPLQESKNYLFFYTPLQSYLSKVLPPCAPVPRCIREGRIKHWYSHVWRCGYLNRGILFCRYSLSLFLLDPIVLQAVFPLERRLCSYCYDKWKSGRKNNFMQTAVYYIVLALLWGIFSLVSFTVMLPHPITRIQKLLIFLIVLTWSNCSASSFSFREEALLLW